jgi:hypothetical protein
VGGMGKLLSITATPAQNALDRLIDVGILEEVTGQRGIGFIWREKLCG